MIELRTGIKMGYREVGETGSQSVVMIHGATDSSLSFSQVAPLVADAGYHVFLPELRGHGESDKPDEFYKISLLAEDIAAFMEMRAGPAHLVGHSIGSFVAQELAITRPDLVLSLTLIGASDKMAGSKALQWILYGADDFPGALALQGEMSDEFLIDWTSSDNEDAAFVQGTFDHAKRLPGHVWINTFCGSEDLNNSQRLAEITLPVQIIWGTGDDFFKKRDQLSLINSLGSDMLLYIQKPGKGHNIHWEKGMAKEIAEDICKFIKGT